MNILLHICCAPCSFYPVEELKKQGHQFAGFFYNPNIHLYSEYLKRRAEVEKHSKKEAYNVIYPDYEMEKFFQYVTDNEDARNRCPVCWWLRLEKTARFACENGFEAFTTTLLGSPYQDHDTIQKIGADIASKAGLKFYYTDFRAGFKDGQDKARAEDYYLQNYCGCIFSEKEKIERKKPRA
ncbi:MAG: epoxyqueuosine reductase QueH [Candidatus Omnitrophica bacterium]|nr:epoxyqueuosine reductase QueH [Candidatus Omnitrophota bacterium]